MPYVPGKPEEELERELGFAPGSTLKLASNENPLGPSPLALAAMQERLPTLHRYPDGAAFSLRQALARAHGVTMDEIVVGAGSNELINLLVLTFVDAAQDGVLISDCSFLCYELACKTLGVPVVSVAMRQHTVDLEAMAANISPNTKMVFLGNPNNPTGTYFNRKSLEQFLKQVPARTIVVVDEAYFEYADAADYPSSLQLRDQIRYLVTLRTFSKIHGLAGLRVGYAVAPVEIASFLHRTRAPFNVSSLGQTAALAALTDHEHVRVSQEMNRRERDRLASELVRLGCAVVPSQANFLLVSFSRPAPLVHQQLLLRGIIVRPVANYRLPQHLRMTIGTPEQNTRLLTELAAILQ